MGIPSLWEAFDSCKESKSLMSLATEHRMRAQARGVEAEDASLILGVDMGTCMAECNAGTLASGVNYIHAGGGLYVFYKKLSEFLKVPAVFVFVLDGPARPATKRGRQVRNQPIWWTDLAVQLAEMFGYHVRYAPGEAEAELSKLNAEGCIDGVITSDSDALVFGSQLILRSIPKKSRSYSDEHFVYTTPTQSASLHDQYGPLLTPGSLLLFVLLCGGDYDDGLPDFGTKTAAALAYCGFGDQLLTAFHAIDGTEYERFLVQWRCSIRTELIKDSKGFLKRSRRALAVKIPDTFPSRRVIELYINPVTSWSPGQSLPDPTQWRPIQPSIRGITEFCIQHFQWKNPQVVKTRIGSSLLGGVVSQMLYSPSIRYIPEKKLLQLPNFWRVKILKLSHEKRRGQYRRLFGSHPQPKLLVQTNELISAMGPSYVGSSDDDLTVWPPEFLLKQALHKKISFHKKSSPSAEKQKSPSTASNDRKWVQLGDKHWFIDLSNE